MELIDNFLFIGFPDASNTPEADSHFLVIKRKAIQRNVDLSVAMHARGFRGLLSVFGMLFFASWSRTRMGGNIRWACVS